MIKVILLTIGFFIGHLLHSYMTHDSINYQQIFDRVWFQFWAIIAFWLLTEKV